jgi:hypothetical protein
VTAEELDQGLTRAFMTQYAELGGHRFNGFTDYGDDRNYQGPLLWSEGDCQFRFALALEKRFPGMVHLEFPIAKHTCRDFNPELDKRQYIDIVVSDLKGFDPERDVFAERTHDLFVEVKYAGNSGEKWQFDSEGKISSGVRSDLERLTRNVELGRCRAAALVLVDDKSLLESKAGSGLPWSPLVRPLLASPTQLARSKHGREMRVRLPECCPSCGSPRVAAIVRGMPSDEGYSLAAKRELILTESCEILRDKLYPTFGCFDCAAEGGGHPDPDSAIQAA